MRSLFVIEFHVLFYCYSEENRVCFAGYCKKTADRFELIYGRRREHACERSDMMKQPVALRRQAMTKRLLCRQTAAVNAQRRF